MATKFDPSKSYAGTCQACFCTQVAKRHSRRNGARSRHVADPSATVTLVLHGYQRPGDGWIVGDCSGHGEEPYELSCEYTKAWRASVEQMIARCRETLAALRADKVETLHINYPVPASERRQRWARETRSIEITRGWVDPAASDYDYDRKYGRPLTFERCRLDRIADLEGHERQMVHTVKFLTGKIDAWSYRPEALVEHEPWVRERARLSKAEVAAKRRERAVARATKNLATAFRYVGTALNKYRAGVRNASAYGCGDTFETQVRHLTVDGFRVHVSVYGQRGTVEVKTVAELEALSLPPYEVVYPVAPAAKKAPKRRAS